MAAPLIVHGGHSVAALVVLVASRLLLLLVHLEVGQELDPDPLVQVRHGPEEAGHLGRALLEPDGAVIGGQPPRLLPRRKRVSAGGGLADGGGAADGPQVLHCHLQDFCLLQLGRVGLFQGGRDQELEFAQGPVDPVPSPLLDDAPPPLPTGVYH